MKALLLRLRKQLGWGIFFIALIPLVLALVFPPPPLFRDTETSSQLWSVAARFGFFGLIVAFSFVQYAKRYQRSATAPTLSADNVVSELPMFRETYCLVLRTFGRDGYVLLPRTNRKGRRKFYSNLNNPTVATEEVVAAAAKEILALPTVGIIDQAVRLAPPGPVFQRVSNLEWKPVLSRLIRYARVIVLLLGPDQDIGEGFAWEVEQIRALGQATRVIIALPPPDQDEHRHQAALHRACVLLTILNGDGRADAPDTFSVYEMEDRLLPSAITAAYTPSAGIGSWGIVPSQIPGNFLGRTLRRTLSTRRMTSDKVYYSALGEAFRAVRRENDEFVLDASRVDQGSDRSAAASPSLNKPDTRSQPPQTEVGGDPTVASHTRSGNLVVRLFRRPGVKAVIGAVVLCVAASLLLLNVQPGAPSPPVYPTEVGYPSITIISPEWARLDSTLDFSRDGSESLHLYARSTRCIPDLPVCLPSLTDRIPVILQVEGAARIVRPLGGPLFPSLERLNAEATRSDVPVPYALPGSPPAQQYSAVLEGIQGLLITGYAAQPLIASEKARHIFVSPLVQVEKCSDPAASSDVKRLQDCDTFAKPARADPAPPDAVHVTVDSQKANISDLRVDVAQPGQDRSPSDFSSSSKLEWTWNPQSREDRSRPFQVICNYVDINEESTSGWWPAFFSGLLFGLAIAAYFVGLRRYRASGERRSQFVVE